MDLQQVLQPIFQSRSVSGSPVNLGGWRGWLGGNVLTKKGNIVNQNSALTLSAFYNGIEIITNDFAKLPKSVYKKVEDSRLKQVNHPVNFLISKRPNQYMTSFMFDKMMVQYALLKGNGYGEIIRNNASVPVAIQLIDQDKHPVQVIKHQNLLWYKIQGRETPVRAENMIHIPGFSFNGITGVGVVTHAANSLGVNISSQEFATDYYDSKGIGMGVVGTKKEMDGDAKLRYSSGLSKALQSSNSEFSIAIIDEGASFNHVKINPQEAQFLLTQKNGVEEVARWLNIPPHKLKTLDNINNSITENLEISHVLDSIMPWAIKMEQEYNSKLFTEAEINSQYYIKANLNALLRGDLQSKGEYYSKMVQSKIYAPNEIRALEELNPLPGGDELLQPVNLQTQKQIDAKIIESKLKKKEKSNV